MYNEGERYLLKEVELRFRIGENEKENISQIFDNYKSEKIFEEDFYFCLKEYIVKGKNSSEISPCLLRLRKSTKGCFLAFKSFTKNKKSWIEEECKIDNIESVAKILHYMNYEKFLFIKKERRFFKDENVFFNLDHVEKLGLFLELEILSKNVNMAKERLLNIAEKMFKINPRDRIDFGYVQLMEKNSLLGKCFYDS
jgi:adenylate cyclase class 2